MLSVKMSSALLVLALLPLILILGVWQFGPGKPLFASGSTASPATHGVSNVGTSRSAKLKLLTEQFIAVDEGVPARVRQGLELAPIEFLNRELKREGETWRVRRVDGLDAVTYDVS